ncbi:ribonuclease HII [Heliophilum fasciatum]|uniref:Ribonuclease HII n=1 Tax=Heliophilum fasciatum TaxID=35700 RepID=A0A4R2RLY3_9FIRM|nr:ribonuclease HII [Heliophilum fasciatum]MCW2278442.1 ribonuclease HII [Heliophilum fasciatum]TCP63659.1 RNase HII [Heliophilum fasciatum]
MSKGEKRLQAYWAELESSLHTEGMTMIAGVDEVGHGPLAGPVVAGAVIGPPQWQLAGLDDSKKLSAPRREALAQVIRSEALTWGIGIVSARVVDAIGIVPATFLAMERALARLSITPSMVIIDGRAKLPAYHGRQMTLIGGDGLAAPVAAAAILAKVYRDQLMTAYDRFFPGYELGRHKGYGTAAHVQAMEKQGLSLIHRRSFCHRWIDHVNR